jgi:hypothetical protein
MQIQGQQAMKSFQNKSMAQRITDIQQGHQNKNRTIQGSSSGCNPFAITKT